MWFIVGLFLGCIVGWGVCYLMTHKALRRKIEKEIEQRLKAAREKLT